MLKISRSAGLLPVVAFASLLALGAQVSKPAQAAAPVPQQILSAQKVFISNGGGACDPFFEEPIFSGGPARAYNQFYAAIKSWGRYQLVPAPADAELTFEISLSCRDVFRGPGGSHRPQLILVIRDVKTHTVLWKITESVEAALLQVNRDRNLDRAMHRLVLNLKHLTAATHLRATQATQ
ncbi:MAG: hypothetical protein P8Z30_16415 [Acidobacteriota bacterium]